MKALITFFGATDHVTGSKTLLTYGQHRLLIDCGLFQGESLIRSRNWQGPTFSPSETQKIILTHAHLDHSGYIPRFVSAGFRGEIWCTAGTRDLANILLRDAAYLEEENARFMNEYHLSRHEPAIPLFTLEDAERSLKHFAVKERHQSYDLAEGLSCRFLRAGHITGASMVEFQFQWGRQSHRLTFSGDLGHRRSFTIRDPDILDECDALVLEATYGNRLHNRDDITKAFAAIINKTVKKNGVLIIPSFAVGRSQEILYLIRLMEDQKLIPQIPVVLDSPMAKDATAIFFKHVDDNKLSSPFHQASGLVPHRLSVTQTPDDSMLTTMQEGPMTVVSASGMLTGGRILHHLKARLPDPSNTVLFTGYQADGSKGQYLQERAAQEGSIRIHRQDIRVRASIETLEGLSAHADYQDILEWLSPMRRKPKRIILIHGSGDAKKHLAEKIKEAYNIEVLIPKPKEFMSFPI